MSYGIQDILTPQFLGDMYTKVASINSPSLPFFDFFSANVGTETGDRVEIFVNPDTRKAAPLNSRGAPAKSLEQVGASSFWLSPLHMFNDFTLSSDSLEFLREESSPALQQKGMAEIRRQMDYFAKRHRIARVVSMAKILSDGVLYVDADGMPLESSTGAAQTIEARVDASHKSQLNHTSAGANIIGTAWDNTAATILLDLEQIRTAAEYDMAPIPRHVWMHGETKPWIYKNAEIVDFYKYNASAVSYLDFAAGAFNEIQLGDWTFHFSSATYIGADGSTTRPLIPKTKAIITPDPADGNWWYAKNFSETIPTGDGLIASIDEYNAKTQIVHGPYSYAQMLTNPLRLAVFMGDNWLYAFNDPNAIWMPTVDF